MKPFTTAAGAVPDRTCAFSDTSNGIHRTARAAGRWWIQFSQIHGAKSGWRRLPFTKRSRTGQDRRIRGKLVLAKPDDRQPDYLVSHIVDRCARSGGEMARRLIARPFAERWISMFSMFSLLQDTASLRCQTTISTLRSQPSPRHSGRALPRCPGSKSRSAPETCLRGSCDPRMTA